MAYAKITFEHPQTGIIKQAPVGFCWAFFCFGPVVALLRGDIKGMFVMVFLTMVTSGFSLLFYPFLYNKLYIKTLLKKGFRVSAVEGTDLSALRQKLRINLPEK